MRRESILYASSERHGSRGRRRFYAKAGAVAEEVLFAIRTVAAFGGEDRESKRYDGFLTEGRAEGVKLASQVGLSTCLVLGAMFAIDGLALYIGGVLIENSVTNHSTGNVYM
jgi:hypothetical protein